MSTVLRYSKSLSAQKRPFELFPCGLEHLIDGLLSKWNVIWFQCHSLNNCIRISFQNYPKLILNQLFNYCCPVHSPSINDLVQCENDDVQTVKQTSFLNVLSQDLIDTFIQAVQYTCQNQLGNKLQLPVIICGQLHTPFSLEDPIT